MTLKSNSPHSLLPTSSWLLSALIGLAALATGCTTTPSPAERQAQQRGVDIHELLRRSGSYLYAQDANSNVVAYRKLKGLRTDAFDKPRAAVQGYADNCHANGGRFELEKRGSNNIGQVAAQAQQASWNQAIATYEFWMQYGISAPGAALETFRLEMAERNAAIARAAFLFDSAVRTENVGTFVCIDDSRRTARWRLHRELYNAHKGYVSDGGMYNFPDGYSVYFTETVIAYDKRQYATGAAGFATLPTSSTSLLYPATGFYVVLEPQGGQWRVSKATPYRSSQGTHMAALHNAPQRTNDRQEIVILSEDGRFAAPAYRDTEVKFAPSDSDLSRNHCHVDQIADRARYSICNSAFTDTPRPVGTGLTAATYLFGRGPNASYNLKLTRTVSFQPDVFWRILNEAQVGAVIAAAPQASLNSNGTGRTLPQPTRP